MRKLLLHWLPWLLMIKRPGQHITKSVLLKSCKTRKTKLKREKPDILLTTTENEYIEAPLNPSKLISGEPNVYDIENRIKTCIRNLDISPNMDYGMKALMLSMLEILHELNFIHKRMKREEMMQKAKNEWKFAAMVVDRLCLFIFTIIVICCNCGILFAPPHVFV